MIDSPAEFCGEEELYAPCAREAWVLAHLGQSLDGRIATRSGASHYINGPENLTHLHRLRALADAVVVGAATVALDDPRLTARRVEGANPVRIVLDPNRRLPVERHAFTEADAPTETSEGAQQVNTTSNDLVKVAHQQQALIHHFKV